MLKDIKSDFNNNGYVVISDDELMKDLSVLKIIFDLKIKSEIAKHAAPRKLISLFTNLPEVRDFIAKLASIVDQLDIEPVYCGPAVTHYTSNNEIGRSFGLDWHQDFPSMASSKSSVIAWASLTESGVSTHGLEVLPRSHTQGVLPGEQSEEGYVLDLTAKELEQSKILSLPNGGIVIFSSFLAHRTFVNSSFSGEKIAFSQRFDDFRDQEWHGSGLPIAYGNKVDRSLYKTRKKNGGENITKD